MKRKALVSAGLAIAMGATLMAGCGSSGSTTATTAPTAAATAAAAKTPVNLTVEVFDRANAPAGAGSADNNALTALIQEKFGTPNAINIKWVPVPRSQEVDKLNMLMASGTAPDIVFTYTKDLYLQYARQGGLTDLTDLFAKTTTLKGHVEKMKDDLLYKGKYYAAASYRGRIDRHVDNIRQDWLDKVGMKAPTTTEEFYAVMKAFKEKDPGGLGAKNYPFGIRTTNATDIMLGANHLVWSFVTASEEERWTMPYLAMPGMKEGWRLINKMYNEGMIDPEFALDQDEKNFRTNLANGKIGFFTDDPGRVFGDLQTSLEKNVPGAKYTPVEVFKNKDGKYAKSIYPRTGWYVMVPKTAKAESAQAAVKYMDWIASSEGAKLVGWGTEGKNYTLKDGVPTYNDDQKKVNEKERFNAGDLNLMWNSGYNTSDDLALKAIEMSDSKNGKTMAQEAQLSAHDGFRDYQANPAFDTAIEASGKYQVNLDKIQKDGLAKVIMAKTADFDKVYDALLADYLKNGGQEIIDQKKAAYKSMK